MNATRERAVPVVPEPTTGLSGVEAARRLAADGPNATARPRPRRLAGRVLRQFTDPLVALLLAAGAVTAALGDRPNTAVILLVVVVNTVIGVAQEVRADRAIAALDTLAAPTARVVRDGADLVLPAAGLVRGDLVRLQAGDVVPADLRLVEARRLRLDESALTGESVPVARRAGDEAAAGTVLLTGRGAGVVVRTGAASALGRIAALVAGARPGPTPLQRRLVGLGRVLGAVVVVLSAVVFTLGVLNGRPVVDMAVTAVSLVVAAVPESMPAVVTLALALGARQMAAALAIPRRLHAVETLGSVTVVAADKTGTLTEGRMAAQRAVTADGDEFAMHGRGYEPHGGIDGHPAGAAAPEPLRRLARYALLCGDATLAPPTSDSPRWSAVGDPLEAALVAFAARCGLDPDAERRARPRLAEQPFDEVLRRMTTVHAEPDGRYLVVCKGAPEVVLRPPLVDASAPHLADLTAAAHRLAAEGYRLIAVAAAVVADHPDPHHPGGLRPAGLLALGDPLRPTAAATVAAFRRAGIRLVLITGDHPGTAAVIGRRLGLVGDRDSVVRGDREPLEPDRVAHATVFARTRPEQKLDIVRALQERGEVLAMTGDGVNDAPALRRADIGVAMGGGTEVARQAADLVLVDDNLGTVATAVAEGRRIYANIRRFLRYGLAGGLAEILVMLAGPALGLAVPLLPAQILWVNLLTHGLPGVALGAEPAEPGGMDRPPRSPRESVLGGGMWRSVLGIGALIGAVALGAGLVAHRLGRPWQSVIFVVLGLAQLGVALAVRARRAKGGPGNWTLPAAVALSAVLQVAGVLLPPLRGLLGTAALGPVELLACALVAGLPGAVLLIGRRRRARGPDRSGPSALPAGRRPTAGWSA
ncbi:cation-translocating P-type ATPase [Rhizomonospora bruguierae]|uniref:cation-translocating P-type ATPase n=1 Tax=Rhizomonospora bruguierae TaxID=1581705 RepID=UPI001BCEEA7B|nr:cation-transporting P-type ATPase [Micromonospora sp. NBRC 107566]